MFDIVLVFVVTVFFKIIIKIYMLVKNVIKLIFACKINKKNIFL
jgi:hypothetical protein